jgi:hypothetical protein
MLQRVVPHDARPLIVLDTKRDTDHVIFPVHIEAGGFDIEEDFLIRTEIERLRKRVQVSSSSRSTSKRGCTHEQGGHATLTASEVSVPSGQRSEGYLPGAQDQIRFHPALL